MLKQLILNVRDGEKITIYKVESVNINGLNVKFIPINATHSLELTVNEYIKDSLRFIIDSNESYIGSMDMMAENGVVKSLYDINITHEYYVLSNQRSNYFTIKCNDYNYISMQYDKITICDDKVVFYYGDIVHEISYKGLHYTMGNDYMEIYNTIKVEFQEQQYKDLTADICNPTSNTINVCHTIDNNSSYKNIIVCEENFFNTNGFEFNFYSSTDSRSINVSAEE